MITRIFIPVLILLMTGCATKIENSEFLSWSAGNEVWNIGYFNEVPNQYLIAEFVREGNDIKNWKELVTIQNYGHNWGGETPVAAYEKLKTVTQQNCPDLTEWNVIKTDDNSILYEWQSKPCGKWSDQHELSRIIFGNNNRFIIRYTKKIYQMENDNREKWINILSEARVEKQ